MRKDYTTDSHGDVAVPSTTGGYFSRTERLPYVLGQGTVREYAREIADEIISAARLGPGPVVWITSNSYMPPMRDITLAERVWQAENNEDGELWAFLVETVEDHLSRENVLLECPEYDNALYAVDLMRWQYKEPTINDIDDFDDINDEWEPVDPHATDDNHDNPRG